MNAASQLRCFVLWANTFLVLAMAAGYAALWFGCGWTLLGAPDNAFICFVMLGMPLMLCYLPAREPAAVWVQAATLLPLLLMVITNVYAIVVSDGEDAPLLWVIVQASIALVTITGHAVLRLALLMARKWRGTPER